MITFRKKYLWIGEWSVKNTGVYFPLVFFFTIFAACTKSNKTICLITTFTSKLVKVWLKIYPFQICILCNIPEVSVWPHVEENEQHAGAVNDHRGQGGRPRDEAHVPRCWVHTWGGWADSNLSRWNEGIHENTRPIQPSPAPRCMVSPQILDTTHCLWTKHGFEFCVRCQNWYFTTAYGLLKVIWGKRKYFVGLNWEIPIWGRQNISNDPGSYSGVCIRIKNTNFGFGHKTKPHTAF